MPLASEDPADVVIVFPPPSPSDTNPPLGPAILAAEAEAAGIRAEVVDLNIAYIRWFSSRQPQYERPTRTLGDHGKNRPLLQAAARELFASWDLEATDLAFLPDVANPAAGMHVSANALRAKVRRFADADDVIVPWIDQYVFYRKQPHVLGISLMGPSQVFVSLVIAARSKQIWPKTKVVFGGSHITLLKPEIQRHALYHENVDKFFFGHSERQLVAYVAGVAGRQLSYKPSRDFRYLPKFEPSQLEGYDRSQITLPLQFTRGCVYARCTYCTYPAVEPELAGLRAPDAVETMLALSAAHGIAKFSLKDSLFTTKMFEALAAELVHVHVTDLRWSATTKVIRRLATLALPLSQVGLRTVELGVETIRPDTQRLIDKQASLDDIEAVVDAFVSAGVVCVVNLMFGFPDETVEQAEAQLDWWLALKRAYEPGSIDGSLNMLEVVRGAPMAEGASGVQVTGIAPWAYAFEWDAPSWRRDLAEVLLREEMATDLPRPIEDLPTDLLAPRRPATRLEREPAVSGDTGEVE